MKAHHKKHICGRLREELDKILAEHHKTSEPDLLTFIDHSIMDGTAELDTTAHILDKARSHLAAGDGYGSKNKHMWRTEIFAAPLEYHQAYGVWHQQNDALEGFRNALALACDQECDLVMMDTYSDHTAPLEHFRSMANECKEMLPK